MRQRDERLARALRERRAEAQDAHRGSPAEFLVGKPWTSQYRCPDDARLAVVQGNEVLAANADASSPDDADFTTLLDSEAAIPWGRQINLWSMAQGRPRPFDVRIDWTAGGGKGGRLELTASGGAVVVFLEAATLKVQAANWHTATQRVGVAVETGAMSQTEELHKVARELNLASGATVTEAVPPYARSLNVLCDDTLERSGLRVDLLDGVGAVIGALFADTSDEIRVGAAEQVRINNLNAGVVSSLMLDFKLGWT